MSQKQKKALIERVGILFTKRERDRISELPDDILFSILSRLAVRDATKTSVLSHRWRYVCASKCRLHFDVRSMFQPYIDASALLKYNTGLCRMYKRKFVRGVSNFLKYYKGSQLQLFRISFCIDQESTNNIDQWITFGLSMGAKDLYLNLSCDDCSYFNETYHSKGLYTLRSGLLNSHDGNMAKVEKLSLHSCILGPEVETILSCCMNLESLIMGNCTLIPILCIPRSLNRLKFLAVIKCSGVEEIELSATNLTHFEYDGDSFKFSFSGAPNLKHVFFRALRKQKLQYVFRKLAKDLPLVETVSVYSTINWVQCLPKEISLFRKVKKLKFFSPALIEFDVLKIIAIFQACPFMEKFQFVMSAVDSEHETPGPSMPLECVHKCLKEVHVGSFHYRTSYIEFAIFMLDSGVALERMVIDPNVEFYYGLDEWWGGSRITWDKGERAKVCARLQDHPKSSVVVIK